MESKGGGLILSPDGSVECFDAWCALDQELQVSAACVLAGGSCAYSSYSSTSTESVPQLLPILTQGFLCAEPRAQGPLATQCSNP